MYQLFVFLALFSAAMLAGLMATLLCVFRNLWMQQSDEMAARSFKEFLSFAVGNRLLATLTILPVICTVVIVFVAKPQAAQPLYAYVGGGVFLIFFFLWTAFFNLPAYKEVETWNPERLPDNMRARINRFHRFNAVRLMGASVASILFFLAA